MRKRGASRQHDATGNNCGAAGGTPTPFMHQLSVGQISECFKACFRRSRGPESLPRVSALAWASVPELTPGRSAQVSAARRSGASFVPC